MAQFLAIRGYSCVKLLVKSTRLCYVRQSRNIESLWYLFYLISFFFRVLVDLYTTVQKSDKSQMIL